MRNIFRKYAVPASGESLQDVLFLVGIFLFISILIIGLFPGRDLDFVVNRQYFVYGVMTVPVIAAIYFIIISARRKRAPESLAIGASIRKKMALAFMFVALLPSLPIVITANYFINQTMSHFLEDRAQRSSGAARIIARIPSELHYHAMAAELDSLEYLVRNAGGSAPLVKGLFGAKKIETLFLNAGGDDSLPAGDADEKVKMLRDFYQVIPFGAGRRVDELSIGGVGYIAGALREKGNIIVLYRELTTDTVARARYGLDELFNYGGIEATLMQFKSRAGIFFFILSIIIIVISVVLGLYLSKNITRPVLELSDAAKKIAAGDFSVEIRHDSDDELGLLYGSFNSMVKELDRTRKTMYQKQKLEAWREMARRLVHEIKNPLTPIRLSAERIRKRYLEKHPDIEKVLMAGTETIIEEVDVLMNILSEFTKFARLPEMKPARADVNEILDSCISFFSGHEQINFLRELNPLPPAWVDKVLMRQAVINLLQNALDAMDKGGTVTVRTEFTGSAQTGTIRVSIRDDGAGVREDELDAIFSPGYSTKPQGSGLGLAIVEKIIMEHGGRIYCRSKPGQGAEFIIELPVSGGGAASGEDTHR